MSRKTKWTLIFLILAGIALLAFYFYQHSLQSPQELTFYLPDKGMPGENHTPEAEKLALPLLSHNGEIIRPVYYRSPLHDFLKSTKTKPDSIDFGLADVPQFISLKKISPSFKPVLAVSPHSTHECFAELQILSHKKSGIESLQDLRGKGLAVTERAMRFSGILNRLLTSTNSLPEKYFLKSPMNEAKQNLLNHKIDAMVIFVSKFSNGQILTKFGSYFEDAYENEPDIKIVHTTDTRLPCRIIFFNLNLEPSFQASFLTHLVNVADTPDHYIALRQYLAIGKMTPLKEEQWQSIKKHFGGKDE